MSPIILPILYIPEKSPDIQLSEVYRYLGYGNQIPDPATSELAIHCAEQISSVMRPRVLYAAYPIRILSGGVQLEEGGLLLPGKDIRAHLAGCQTAILLCATLSAPTDLFIRNRQISDMTSGVITDCCATTAIEQLCDDVETVIKKSYSGCFFTTRYSPGYGDLPLDIQKEFLNTLDAPRKIGLCATDSSILTPRKSVTAIIGISDTPPADKRTGCLHCRLRDTCEFKRKGEFCGLSNTAE